MGISSKRLRSRGLAVLALIALLASLLPAVPAMAANSVTPSTNAIGATSTYKISFDTFTSTITVYELKNKNLTLKFPSGFDVNGLNGKTLDVSITDAVYGSHYMQPVASVNGQSVSVNLPEAAFGSASGSNVSSVVFNGVTVKNPATAGSYTVELWLEGKTSAVATVGVTISAEYPKTVNITALSPTTVKIGNAFNIEVEVKNLTDQPLNGATVSVDIPGVLSTTQSLGSTNALGKVSGTVTVPNTTKPGTYQVVASVGSVSSAAQNITVTAGDPTKIDFVDENNQAITTTLSGTVGQRQKLTVALFDAQDNLTAAASDLVVVLSARESTSGNLAGKFYNAATGGSEIDRVTIPAGQSKVDFWFAPSLISGAISATVQGATGWTEPTVTVSFNAAQVGNITSVSLSADADKVPIFTTPATLGYAFKTTVFLDAIADKDYTVKVEFGSGDEGTWDTVFKPSLVGAKKSGDPFTIPAGSQSKTIYIYPKNVSTTSNTTFDVTATVVGTSLTDIVNYSVVPVSNNTKSLTAGWNVISTPVRLAGNGDFKALFGLTDQDVNNYIDTIVTYDPAAPTKWVNVTSSTQLDPLKAYFVKLKNGVTATYFWKLNTSPQAPEQRSLAAGWNLVGVSAPLGTDGTLNNATSPANESQFFRPVESALLAAVNAKSGAVYNTGSEVTTNNGDAYWVSLSGPATIYSLAVPPYVAE